VHPQNIIQKYTCWILSSITGTEDQITQLFQNVESNAIVAKLVNCAFDYPWDIRKEAIRAVCNILTCGTDRHVECVVSVNGIQALCNALQNQLDATLLLVVMGAFDKLLNADKTYQRKYQVTMEECGGVCHLTQLQDHSNKAVSNKADDIILRYFGEARDDEEENLAPATEDATFTIGVPPKDLLPVGNSSSKVSFGGNSFNKFRK
jgi:hypothetical protein